MLNTYYAKAAPLITRRFGGEVEKFIGDGMMATFNTRGNKPTTRCAPPARRWPSSEN